MSNVVEKVLSVSALIKSEYGHYWRSISVVSILSFISGILEGIGINSIIPLFAFINNASQKGTDFISQFIESFFGFLNITYSLKHLLIFIAILFIIKAIILYLATWLSARLNTSYEKNTRQVLLSKTLEANWPFVARQKIGHLEQILTLDVTNSSNLLSYLTSSILIIANLAVYLLISFNISGLIAALTLVVAVLVFLVFKPLFQRNRAVSGRAEKLYKDLAHFVNQHIIGMKTVKSMAVEKAVNQKGNLYFESVREANMRIIAVRNLTNTMLQPIGLLFILGIFSYFYKLTAFNFASFAVIVYAINKIFAYMQQAQAQLHGLSSYVPYVISLRNYLSEVSQAKEISNGTKPFSFSEKLSFNNVHFSYPGVDTTLKDVSFDVRKREFVGIIGPSGAGKTTIVDLLLGLHTAQNGSITIDGYNLSELALDTWRKKVGYVSQDMFLINDTIENNIRFYDQEITDAGIREAAQLANIHNFVEALPNGYKTSVGERGIMLSGGERQRIVLARVLARKPEILILDEATSALDNESEALIQKAIEGLRTQLTVIAIAHRLSTVMSADKLLIIENGTLTATGKPQDLLSDPNSYLFKVANIREN